MKVALFNLVSQELFVWLALYFESKRLFSFIFPKSELSGQLRLEPYLPSFEY
jgi:hypothetical protein